MLPRPTATFTSTTCSDFHGGMDETADSQNPTIPFPPCEPPQGG